MRFISVDTADEKWSDCLGYEELYRVSDQGRVFNPRRRKCLTGTVTASGYRQVRLTGPGGRVHCLLVHALVLSSFVGPRPPGHVCDHKSFDRLDNRLVNLEWVSPLENAQRAARAGRLRPNPLKGERHHRAKLTEAKVKAIRARHEQGESHIELAREYGITPSAVRKVIARIRWKHVD